MSTSMNVFLNVLVLLPRLQIPIHFVVPIPAPYESFFEFSNTHMGHFKYQKYTFFFGCDVVSPKFTPAVALHYCSHASLRRLKFGPGITVKHEESPSENIPSKTGVEKTLV